MFRRWVTVVFLGFPDIKRVHPGGSAGRRRIFGMASSAADGTIPTTDVLPRLFFLAGLSPGKRSWVPRKLGGGGRKSLPHHELYTNPKTA